MNANALLNVLSNIEQIINENYNSTGDTPYKIDISKKYITLLLLESISINSINEKNISYRVILYHKINKSLFIELTEFIKIVYERFKKPELKTIVKQLREKAEMIDLLESVL